MLLEVIIAVLSVSICGIFLGWRMSVAKSKTRCRESQNSLETLTTLNANLQNKLSTLKESHNVFALTFDGIQNSVIVMDAHLNIIKVNAFAQQLLGFKKRELIGYPFGQCLLNKDAIRFQYIAKSYIDTQNATLLEQTREVKVRHRSDELIHTQLQLHAKEHEGSVLFVATLTDISALKQLTQVYEERAEEALNASLSKSMFLAKMSHEIRTPLHGILGSVQLIERLDDKEKQAKLIRNAIASGENLANIINDILDLSKIESGDMHYEKIPFSMNHIIKRIMSEINPQASINKVDVKCTFSKGFNNHLLGDSTRIGQVIVNLMSNAIKFTRNGSVELNVSFDTSKFEVHSLVVSVKDTGIGIGKVAMKDLFESFKQADDSITRNYGGSGLGLAISRNICRQLGGDLRCASKIGVGSTFTALIPIEISDKAPEIQTVLPSISDLDLSKFKVLMVEDNEINADILAGMLEQSGCVIRHAKDGLEAVETYKSFAPDIILMDIHMPKIDGLTACKIIRSQGCHAPILAVTANVMKDDIQNYQDNGFNGHIAKPIIREKLYERISDVIVH